MSRRILLINGHPDPRPERFCAALAAAYESGARKGGHDVRRITVGDLSFPLIRSEADFRAPALPAQIAAAQQDVRWAEHLVFVYPLWLGEQPALLKGFLEQVFRYGFAIGEGGHFPTPLLKGRTAHIVVTMGMPAPVFRFWYGAYSVRALELGVLKLSGIAPLRRSLIGMVAANANSRSRWLARLEADGEAGR